MSFDNPNGPGLSGIAAVDLSAQQYNIVRLSAENAINLVDSAHLSIEGVGVLYTDPQAGEAGSVFNGGHLKVRSGASIAADKNVTCNASGRAVAITSGTGAFCYGKALTASGGDGQMITMDAAVPFWYEGTN